MDEYIPIIDPEASAAAGYSVPEAGTSMDFSSLFGSMFGMSGENSINMQELMNQYMQFVRDNTDYNNAWSAEQAQKQMDFQALSQQLAQQYNSEEAAKNRNWQEYMSSTAHQREIADLKAAGLNPVLSAMGGNGAAVTSGATASSQAMSGAKGDGDQSMNGAVTSILGSALNVMTSLAQKSIDAQTSLAVADKYTEMERIIESMREEYGAWEHQNYPSGMYEAISAVLHAFGLGDDSPGSGSGSGSTILNSKDVNDFISRNLGSLNTISGGIKKIQELIFGKDVNDGSNESMTKWISALPDPMEGMRAIHNPERYDVFWRTHKPIRSIFPSQVEFKKAWEIWMSQGSKWHSGDGFSGRSGKF